MAANDVFRDYVTDGVPSSGAHKPVKSEIRALLTAYESALGGIGGGGVFTSVDYSTTLTGTSSNSSALSVGRQGATDPVFRVDAATVNAVTGFKVTGAAVGNRVALQVISSGASEGFTIDGKGSATSFINATSTGLLALGNGGGGVAISSALTYGTVTLSNSVTGTGSMVLSASPTLTGTVNAAKLIGTSTDANAFAVGRQGATNPVLNVDASTASVVTGLQIKGAASGARVALQVTSSATNEGMTIETKGNATLFINATATGQIALGNGGGGVAISSALTYGSVTLSNAVTGTGNMVLSASPTLTGTLTVGAVTGSGDVMVTNNQNAGSQFSITNTSAGASATASYTANNGTNSFSFGINGTGKTPFGLLAAGIGYIGNTGDLAIYSVGGKIMWSAAAGLTEQMRLSASGGFGVGVTTDPGAGSIAGSGGAQHAPPTTKTTNYSQATTDYSLIFNGAGSLTLTLLAAATYPGRHLLIKTIAAQTVVSGSSNVVPQAGGAAGTAILAATAGKWALLVSDGTNWQIQSSN